MNKQSGAALLIALIIVVLAVTAGLLSAYNNRNSQTEREQITSTALSKAREALISYALTYPDANQQGGISVFVPGHLPCPDLGAGTEGIAATSCGGRGITSIGMLPWKTLGIPPLRDAQGNCLWYAVSGTFKDQSKAHLLNRDSTGQFVVVDRDGLTTIVGATPETRPGAIIFAPGPPLAGQARSHQGGECGKDYNASAFLDSWGAINHATPNTTAEGLTTVAAQGPSGSQTDRLAWITPSDLFSRNIELRNDFAKSLYDPSFISGVSTTPALTQRVAECFLVFAALQTSDRHLPWAAPLSLNAAAPNTFDNDQFGDSSDLRVGRLPYLVFNSVANIGTVNFSNAPPTTLISCNSATSPSCRLLRVENCPAGWNRVAGYPTTSDSPQGWFDKWKDHLFYAVAEDFQPTATPSNCVSKKCLYVDSYGPFAAVIIFADSKQGTQTRSTTAQKNDPTNYLENENALAIQINDTSNPLFGKFKRTGNDKFVCINPNLTLNLSCT